MKEKRALLIELIVKYTNVEYLKRKSEKFNIFYIDKPKTWSDFNYTYIDFEIIINIEDEDEFYNLFDKEFDNKAMLAGFAVTNKEHFAEQKKAYMTLNTYIK